MLYFVHSGILVDAQIADLLEQGQSAGMYAQMLREILRKMSKDDSKVQLRSLEQVLQLGQNIANIESSERKKSASAGGSPAKEQRSRSLAHAPSIATAVRDNFRHSEGDKVGRPLLLPRSHQLPLCSVSAGTAQACGSQQALPDSGTERQSQTTAAAVHQRQSDCSFQRYPQQRDEHNLS